MRIVLPILLCVLNLLPAAGHGATLIEMSAGAEPLRIVIDRPEQRVLIEDADRHTLFDLNRGFLYHRDGDGPARRAHARYRPGHHEPGRNRA